MIFILNREGTVTETVTSPVYQGSNANEVVVLAPFAPTNTVTVGFTLPNGLIVQPKLTDSGKGTAMTSLPVKDLSLKVGETYEDMSAWYCKLDRDITRYSGTLTMQFFLYDAAGDILASSSTTVPVQKGVPVLDGTTFDTSTAAQLQTALNAVLAKITSIATDTDKNTTDITSLGTRVSANKQNIDGLQSTTAELSQAVDGLDGDSKQLKSEIDALDARMFAAEDSIIENEKNIEEMKTKFVEKVTSAGKLRVYGINPIGGSFIFDVNEFASGSTIVRRSAKGNVRVSDPIDYDDAVNKRWFEESLDGNLDPLKSQLSNIWTILENTIINVTTIEDAYNTRVTAGGLSVVDEAPTTVHKITGASAASINLATVKDQTIVSNGVTFIGSATDGTVQMTGSVTEENEYATATVTTGFYLPVGTYTLYAPHKADKVGWHVRNAQSTSIAELNWNGTTTAVSFTVSAAGSYHLYVFIPRSAGTLDYTETPMLLRGDRTANLPAFEPYYAGVKHASFTGIASCGTALVDFSETVPSLYITNGTLYPNDTFRSETVYCPCAGGVVYRYANEITSGYRQFVVVFYDADKQMLLQTSKASYGTPIAVTSPVGAQYMRCSFSKVMVNGEYTTVPEQPMVYAAETQPPYEPYVGDETFALTTPVTLGKWDTIDVDAQKQVVGTVTETQDTPYTEEQLAQFDEYILSADGKTVAYKTETPTETPLSLPKTYRAWNDGQETITGNPSGLSLTVTQDYYVKAGGENA